MEILKNRRTCKCNMCRGEINNDYKAVWGRHFYHLSCLSKWIDKKIMAFKEDRKKLMKKKKYFIFDGLESR